MSNTPKQSKQYYRPSLTAAEIKHIIALCKTNTSTIESSSILRKLIPFQAKIQNNIISPAFETTPRKTMLESLGGVDANTLAPATNHLTGIAAYNKYTESPESCTLPEIEEAREYAYINDLMKPDETAAYEEERFSLVNPSYRTDEEN